MKKEKKERSSMKVIILNGSPRKKGNCSKVCETFAGYLKEEGIESEILQIGSMDVSGCKGCWACSHTGSCVQPDPFFSRAAEKIYAAEGMLVVAPVYYDGMPGQLKSFLDRLFFQNRGKGGLRGKVAAAFTVQRRVGAVSTLDEIYHYMMCSEMVIATSKGENMMFGLDPGDVMKDEEGQEILSVLANNMTLLMKRLCGKL